MKLIQQLRIQLERIESDRVGHAEKIGEAHEEEHVPLPYLLPIQGGPVRGKKQPLVNLARRLKTLLPADRSYVVRG